MKDELTEKVIGCAMRVHRTLGSGFLESVYAKSLEIELKKADLRVEREFPLHVYYEDECVGSFFADIVVERQLILELKAVAALCKAHEVQLVNYLNATGYDRGLLFNFGTSSLEFKRKVKHLVNPVNPVEK